MTASFVPRRESMMFESLVKIKIEIEFRRCVDISDDESTKNMTDFDKKNSYFIFLLNFLKHTRNCFKVVRYCLVEYSCVIKEYYSTRGCTSDEQIQHCQTNQNKC